MKTTLDWISARVTDGAVWLVTVSARHARAVVVAALGLTALSCWYVVTNIAINTDDTDMLSAELPFRQRAAEMRGAFPERGGDTLAVVIDGATPGIADDAALRLAEAFRARPQVFGKVSDLAGDPFFRRNGLLFMEEDELGRLLDRLAQAQPFLGSLAQDPSLRGFLSVLSLALDEVARGGDAEGFDLTSALDRLAEVADARVEGLPAWFPWRRLLGGEDDALVSDRRVLLLKPGLDFSSLAPAARAMSAVRQTARDLGLTPENGVRVRLTGSAALASEELESVGEGMGLAGALSFALVAVLLVLGLRSLRRVGAVVVPLVGGLVWTTAFAILAIGELNLISVAFAVLFIGLAVDFGIHFTLRYDEAAGSGKVAALQETARGVGGGLLLAAVAAAIGFLSFLPTAYRGLAELGVIAGAGMFIALVANLTVLPAMLALQRQREPRRRAEGRDGRFYRAIRRHARAVAASAALLGLGAAAALPFVRFDFDPLNLKDAETESVSTLFDLMRDGTGSPYTIEVLAPDLQAAEQMAARLADLSEVRSARTIADYVPEDQEAKAQMVETAALFLLPALEPLDAMAKPDEGDLRRALRGTLDRLRTIPPEHRESAAARRLEAALAKVLEGGDAATRSLQEAVVRTLPGTLTMLRQSMEAMPFGLEDLPAELRQANLAADGRARIEVTPARDARDPETLRRFLAAVRTVAPGAAGSPVTIVEAGDAVVFAFVEAGIIAFSAIALLLGIVLRRLRNVILVFAPIALAGVLMAATSVLVDIPFNFANVIVLPLLFGLGVASGIHLIHREEGEAEEAMATSTPRAVLYSALTTIGSFASMALSQHPGTASMGTLLTLAIVLTMASTLIVLPALMALFPGTPSRSGE